MTTEADPFTVADPFPVPADLWVDALRITHAAGLDPDQGRHVTAVHEAGHVWAYRRERLPIRYVTVRPRQSGASGLVMVRPRRVRYWSNVFVACAGPIAEATYYMLTAADDASGWEDHMFRACLSGYGVQGSDVDHAGGMLDGPRTLAWSSGTRNDMLRDWAGVMALAARLVDVGTVQGREAFDVIGG